MIEFFVLVLLGSAAVGVLFGGGYWAWVEDEAISRHDDAWDLLDDVEFQTAVDAGMFDIPLEELGRLRESDR